MKVDGKLNVWGTAEVVEEARHHEKAGYDGLWASESKHDPFLPLMLAAEHTDRLELGTAIAVAFARSPMQLAYTAHDLQTLRRRPVHRSGLGSQIKPHIERALRHAVEPAGGPDAGVRQRAARHLGGLERRRRSSTSGATSTRTP